MEKIKGHKQEKVGREGKRKKSPRPTISPCPNFSP